MGVVKKAPFWCVLICAGLIRVRIWIWLHSISLGLGDWVKWSMGRGVVD